MFTLILPRASVVLKIGLSRDQDTDLPGLAITKVWVIFPNGLDKSRQTYVLKKSTITTKPEYIFVCFTNPTAIFCSSVSWILYCNCHVLEPQHVNTCFFSKPRRKPTDFCGYVARKIVFVLRTLCTNCGTITTYKPALHSVTKWRPS